MFTGIIAAVGEIQNITAADDKKNHSVFVRIKKPKGWNVKLGESVNIDGVCSTVKSMQRDSFEVEYMPETLKKTAVQFLRRSGAVNLERALRANDRLSGHLVQGHVDTTGRVTALKRAGDSLVMKINFPGGYRRFVARKGSITVNGVSLTVVDAGSAWFTVSLVAFTLEHTNLHRLRKGDRVNIEVDVLARYLDALVRRGK